MPIRRGEIRWADLNPVRGHEQAGKRPVLVLSQDVFNDRSRTVVAVPLTSQPQRMIFPLVHELQDTALPKKPWVLICQVRTLARDRFGKTIGNATSADMAAVLEGLNEILGS